MFGHNKWHDRHSGAENRRGGHRHHALFMAGAFGHGHGHGRGPIGDGPFGGGPMDGGPIHGGPMGGRRGKRFDGEELRWMVLCLLGEAPQHGYQLIRAFAEKSGGAYQPSPGVLYPLLTMLAEMALIAEVDGGEGTTRRKFAITDAGRAEIAPHSAKIAALFARLAALAEVAGRTDAGPVRRAVHNLRSAVVERLGRDGADQDLACDIARLIDEATQRIERL